MTSTNIVPTTFTVQVFDVGSSAPKDEFEMAIPQFTKGTTYGSTCTYGAPKGWAMNNPGSSSKRQSCRVCYRDRPTSQ